MLGNGQTDTHTHTTTVILAAYACRGLINKLLQPRASKQLEIAITVRDQTMWHLYIPLPIAQPVIHEHANLVMSMFMHECATCLNMY